MSRRVSSGMELLKGVWGLGIRPEKQGHFLQSWRHRLGDTEGRWFVRCLLSRQTRSTPRWLRQTGRREVTPRLSGGVRANTYCRSCANDFRIQVSRSFRRRELLWI